MYEMEKNFEPKATSRPLGFRMVWIYYIATPVFLVIELLWGVSFRVPFFITSSLARCVYYGFCLSCGGACYFRPGITFFVGLVESTINVVLLFVGFGSVLLNVITNAMEFGEASQTFLIKSAISFAVTGIIWIACFKYSLSIFERKLAGKG
jgi:hypothetical protein